MRFLCAESSAESRTATNFFRYAGSLTLSVNTKECLRNPKGAHIREIDFSESSYPIKPMSRIGKKALHYANGRENLKYTVHIIKARQTVSDDAEIKR